MADYQFLTIWLLDAPIDKVWDAIVDYEHMPSWWTALKSVKQIQSGDAAGVGSRWLLVWKMPFSYSLAFESCLTCVEPPFRLELNALGEVEGTGCWQLSTTPEGTLIHYYWLVRTTKTWMNLLALFIRPLLEWNHNAVMHSGAKALAQYLGAHLLKSENTIISSSR